MIGEDPLNSSLPTSALLSLGAAKPDHILNITVTYTYPRVQMRNRLLADHTALQVGGVVGGALLI